MLLQSGPPLSRIPYFSRFLDPAAGNLWDASGSGSTPGREGNVGRVPSVLISAIPTETPGEKKWEFPFLLGVRERSAWDVVNEPSAIPWKCWNKGNWETPISQVFI